LILLKLSVAVWCYSRASTASSRSDGDALASANTDVRAKATSFRLHRLPSSSPGDEEPPLKERGLMKGFMTTLYCYEPVKVVDVALQTSTTRVIRAKCRIINSSPGCGRMLS
jgi:hypothetical protein